MYGSPSISVSSVMFGIIRSASPQSLRISAGKSGPNVEYSSPLSAITGSTYTFVPGPLIIAIAFLTTSTWSFEPKNPV